MENHAESNTDNFLEVAPLDRDQFLKVKETLTRIGIPANMRQAERPVLWQSCHILQKRGRYYIVHFKQLFLLDGKAAEEDISDEDLDRVEYVAALLAEWGLIQPLFQLEKPKVSVKIVPYSQKYDWDLRSKYSIGVRK